MMMKHLLAGVCVIGILVTAACSDSGSVIGPNGDGLDRTGGPSDGNPGTINGPIGGGGPKGDEKKDELKATFQFAVTGVLPFSGTGDNPEYRMIGLTDGVNRPSVWLVALTGHLRGIGALMIFNQTPLTVGTYTIMTEQQLPGAPPNAVTMTLAEKEESAKPDGRAFSATDGTVTITRADDSWIVGNFQVTGESLDANGDVVGEGKASGTFVVPVEP